MQYYLLHGGTFSEKVLYLYRSTDLKAIIIHYKQLLKRIIIFYNRTVKP